MGHNRAAGAIFSGIIIVIPGFFVLLVFRAAGAIFRHIIAPEARFFGYIERALWTSFVLNITLEHTLRHPRKCFTLEQNRGGSAPAVL